MAKGKDRIDEVDNKLDIFNFKVVKTTRSRVRGVVLPPDIASASDATGYANTIADVFESGEGGIFQHGEDETEFKKVLEHRLKIKEKKYKKPDFSKFVLVKTSESTRIRGVVLPPDIAADPDATEVANTIAKAFETGKGGIFQHGAGKTKFKKR